MGGGEGKIRNESSPYSLPAFLWTKGCPPIMSLEKKEEINRFLRHGRHPNMPPAKRGRAVVKGAVHADIDTKSVIKGKKTVKR